MGREVRQRGNQPRPAEERVAEGFVPKEEKDIFHGGQDRRITVNDSGLEIKADKINLDGEVRHENEVDTVVKHEVPVGTIIQFDVFNNPVAGPEKIGRVMVKVNGGVYAWHDLKLSTVKKQSEVIDWLNDNLDVATKFPNGIVFEWAEFETGLEE